MKVVLFNSLTKKGILMTLKSTRDMIEKVNISQALNSLSVKTNADFFYGEESCVPLKIKKNVFFNLLPFKNYLRFASEDYR